MESNDKYNLLKKLLESGENNKIILAQKIGYTGATDKRLRDSLNRFLNKHLDLKKLLEDSKKTISKESIKRNNYKKIQNAPMEIPENLSTFEDLISISDNNIVMKIITNKITELEKNINNQNNYKRNHTEIFILEDKYNHIDQDEIIPVSLRITRESKKALDKFCRENSGHKKIHIVSQMIMEFIEKYNN